MIDMFTNYQNLSEYYIPNNLSKSNTQVQSYTKLTSNNNTKPYELYNAKGELEGYFWHYGDQIDLEFSLQGELTLDDDTPTGNYIDVQDFLEDKNIIIRLYDFRFNIIYSKVSNIQYEAMTSPAKDNIIDYIDGGTAFSDSSLNPDVEPTAKLSIDAELSKKLVKGVYYCSLEVDGHSFHETLFAPQDCKLLVK